MYHIAKTITPLNIAINNYFTAFKDDILTYSTKQWKEEDIKGKSIAQWRAMQYYDLMYLLIVLHQEIVRTLHLNCDWSYYVTKFKLDKYQKCIQCEEIDWDKAIDSFGLNDLVPQGGIENMGIEINFVIQNSDKNKFSLSVSYLAENPYICNNYIN